MWLNLANIISIENAFCDEVVGQWKHKREWKTMNFNPDILQMCYWKPHGRLHRCWKPCRWIYWSFLKLYSHRALALKQQGMSNFILGFTKQANLFVCSKSIPLEVTQMYIFTHKLCCTCLSLCILVISDCCEVPEILLFMLPTYVKLRYPDQERGSISNYMRLNYQLQAI